MRRLIPWLVLMISLSPVIFAVQGRLTYSDSPFLTPRYQAVEVENVLNQYFNFTPFDYIYVIVNGTYNSSLEEVMEALHYLQGAKLVTPQDYLSQENWTYTNFTEEIARRGTEYLLPLHYLYGNLSELRDFLLLNLTEFQYELNVTYGLPLNQFHASGGRASQFLTLYHSLGGEMIYAARNASLRVFRNPFVLYFSFNNYSNSSLTFSFLRDFSDFPGLVEILTGVRVPLEALQDPSTYSLSQARRILGPPPITTSNFHRDDLWLFVIQVPQNESLQDVSNFMANLRGLVTGHLPIYAASESATARDLKVIDVTTVLLLTSLLLILIRSPVPILILILSALLGLEVAYSALLLLSYLGFPIYYISGLVVPPIVFGITVDYSVLFLYRYFEEVRGGDTNPLGKAFRIAGKAVLLSGLSIGVGFSSFIFTPSPLLRNVGVALVLSSLSPLLPSLIFTREALASIPSHILAFPRREVPNPVDVRQKYLERVSRWATRRKYLVVGALVVGAAISYYFSSIHSYNVNITEIVPSNSEVVEGERALTNLFNYSVDYILLKGNTPAVQVEQRLLRDGALVYGPSAFGRTILNFTVPSYNSHGYTLIEAYIPYPTFSNGAVNLTEVLIREGYAVGGSNAERVDVVEDTVNSYYSFTLPLAILAITAYIALSLGSVVVPLRLSLTLLASSLVGVGLLYAVFDTVYWLSPLIVFAMMFSLGIDYDMFIILRVLEESGTEEERVIRAISKTGLVVTAAGTILAGAFLSLTAAHMRFLQEVGFSVGISILFDTFVVRPIVVPAVMNVLGKHNWWPGYGRSSRGTGKG